MSHLVHSEAFYGFADESTLITGVDPALPASTRHFYHRRFYTMSVAYVRLTELSIQKPLATEVALDFSLLQRSKQEIRLL